MAEPIATSRVIATAQVAEHLEEVRGRIASTGVDPATVRVVAVTKGFGVEACHAALDCGLSDLGENYADELVSKSRALATGDREARWHFLGAIQRNKIGSLVDHVSIFEGIDRAIEAEAIARRAPNATVYVEVAGSQDPGRGGVALDEVEALVEQIAKTDLVLGGLMTVAPPGDRVAAAALFATVRGLVDRLGLAEASMGMSDDLEIAVEQGATSVRIGRGLFGPRPPR